MYNVLVIGKDSYIGRTFIEYCKNRKPSWFFSELDVANVNWQHTDFSSYDVVIQLAGIAHIKESQHNRDLYFKVNRDLAIQCALKAKSSQVSHFVLMSSMSVFGVKTGCIDRDTPLSPKSAYGKSKLEAEQKILDLRDDSFTVSVLRPPMVYGPNCKGNYPRLSALVKRLPIFPYVSNRRSMIFIDHLCESLILAIESQHSEIYHPQNAEYVSTSELVKYIATAHNQRIRFVKGFAWLLRKLPSGFSKLFGDLYYDYDLSGSHAISNLPFSETIKISELG